MALVPIYQRPLWYCPPYPVSYLPYYHMPVYPLMYPQPIWHPSIYTPYPSYTTNQTAYPIHSTATYPSAHNPGNYFIWPSGY